MVLVNLMAKGYQRVPPATGGGNAANRYFRPATSNVELPRGYTTDHDVLFDESTQTLSTRGGAAFSLVWNWKDVKYGGSRWLNKNSSVSCTDWTTFLSQVAAFVAGTGDWEIRVPATMTMGVGNGLSSWTVPTVTGKRWLFVTLNGTLPTADVMPDVTNLANYSVWSGPSGNNYNSLIDILSPNTCGLTLTGIYLKPVGTVNGLGHVNFRNPSAVTMADAPYGLVMDRCVIDGINQSAQTNGQIRGINANGAQLAVMETWIINICGSITPGGTQETKGIGGYSQSKWHFFRNVFIESLAIGHLYGGADPSNTNTGINDPSDILSINCVCSKYLPWMTGRNAGTAPYDGMKNGFESKNVSRWAIFNSITLRNAAGGQNGPSMLFQNLQDNGNNNANYNINADILVYNHLIQDCPAGLSVLSQVNYPVSTSPVNPTQRIAFVNFHLKGLGNNWNAVTSSVYNPLRLFKNLQSVLVDQWTVTPINTNTPRYIELSGSGASNVRITNFAGPHMGIFGETPLGNFGQQALSSLGQYCSGAVPYTWAGNAGFGSPQFAGGTYTPGMTIYANAAAMGFDTTTGVLSAPGNTVGVGGQSPGCNFTQLNAGLASMQSWAFTR